MSHWRRSGVFIGNFEHISHLVLVLLFLTLGMKMPAGTAIILKVSCISQISLGLLLYEKNVLTTVGVTGITRQKKCLG